MNSLVKGGFLASFTFLWCMVAVTNSCGHIAAIVDERSTFVLHRVIVVQPRSAIVDERLIAAYNPSLPVANSSIAVEKPNTAVLGNKL